MQSSEPKPKTYRLPDSLVAKIEAEAEAKKQTATDVVRAALDEYVRNGPGRSNFERIMARVDQLEYEVIRTRAVMLRSLDPDEKITKEILDEASEDARAYLEQRRKEVI